MTLIVICEAPHPGHHFRGNVSSAYFAERSFNGSAACHGFCAALDRHHRGEDRTLFPAIEAAYPELAPVLRSLQQDHSVIAYLLSRLSSALDRSASPEELERHLDGLGAIMENHFRYEERQLLTVLDNTYLPPDETASRIVDWLETARS